MNLWMWLREHKDLRNLTVLFLGLAFLLLLGSNLVARGVVLLTKAAPAGSISLSESYVLGSKLTAVADGKDVAKFLVFVRDAESRGVAAKVVTVSGLPSLEGREAKTDTDGMASFEATSSVSGQFALTASVNGVPLPGEVILTFK